MPRQRSQIMAQVAFLCFNLGKAAAPFILTPFLAPEGNTTKSAQLAGTGQQTPIQSDTNESVIDEPVTSSGITDIAYGFSIISISSLVLSVFNIAIFLANGCKVIGDQRQKKKHNTVVGHIMSKTRTVLMFLGFLSMIFVQCGMETADAGLITSYISEYLHMGKTLAVAITGLYQGVKVIACIFVVFAIRRLFPSTILLIDIILLVSSTVTMTLTIIFDAPSGVLWLSIIIMSLGASNYLATQVSWFETRVPITGKISSMICVSFGLGGMLLPYVTTALLESYGPVGFPLVMLICSCILLSQFIFIKVVLAEGCCPDVSLLYQQAEQESVIVVQAYNTDNH